jgi:hypothetical protein
LRRKYIGFGVIVVVLLIVIVILFWTLSAPQALKVQSPSDLQSGIFSISTSQNSLNATDGAGSYSFRFGVDYNTNVSQGSALEIKVYGVLVSEKITSSFTRAISLTVNSASLLIDNSDDTSVQAVMSVRDGILTESFQNLDSSLPVGSHNLTIALLVSVVDLNYIGYSVGAPMAESLSGYFNVTQS